MKSVNYLRNYVQCTIDNIALYVVLRKGINGGVHIVNQKVAKDARKMTKDVEDDDRWQKTTTALKECLELTMSSRRRDPIPPTCSDVVMT